MSTEPNACSENLDSDACWRLLERVASTPTLKRATRLREFLLYVGNKSLKEGRTDIHEQEIGETVFARPHNYETSQDNIVRVSATELRKRVDSYFATEGASEPIFFEIPRGSYLPVFRPRDLASQSSHGAPNRKISFDGTPLPNGRALLWIVSTIAALLAIACFVLWKENAALQHRIQSLEHASVAAQSLSASLG